MPEYISVTLGVILTLGLILICAPIDKKYQKLFSISGAFMLIIFSVNWFGGYNNLLLVCGFTLIIFANKN